MRIVVAADFFAVLILLKTFFFATRFARRSWQPDKGSRPDRPYTKSSIGSTLVPSEPEQPEQPVQSPSRPSHLNLANNTPLKYTIPSSVIAIMTLLNSSKSIFLSTCLRITAGKRLISLDEFRLCLTHAKVNLTNQQWTTFKEVRSNEERSDDSPVFNVSAAHPPIVSCSLRLRRT